MPVPAPPPGFTLDSAGDAPPPPPPGFTLDGPAPALPPPAAPVQRGVVKNLQAGSTESFTGLAGQFLDATVFAPWTAERIFAQAYNDANRILGHNRPQDMLPSAPSAQHALNVALSPAGANPEDVQAPTLTEKVARGVGAGLPAAFMPGAEGMTVGRTLQQLMIGGGAGAGSVLANEALPQGTPEPVRTVASLLGGAAGALLTHGAMGSTAALLSGAGKIADPFTAAASHGAAEAQAGKVLAGRATDPAAAVSALAEPAEIVPGSQPTTFQQTGDMGLGALEREQATKNPELFRQRQADQNAARVSALDNIQAGGDPNALAGGVKGIFDTLDAETQGHVDAVAEAHNEQLGRTMAAGEAESGAATEAARGQAAALGGEGAPEGYGTALRQGVIDAEKAEKDRLGGLYAAVDPEGTMTGNVSHTIAEAKNIENDIGPTAKPMTGEEAAIFDAAQNMSPLSKFTDLQDLRSRVSTEARRQQLPDGDPQVYRRLTLLKGAIQDNIANTIAQRISNETNAVSRGTIPEADSAAARLQAWVNDWKQQSAEARGVGGGGAGGAAPAAAGAGAGGDGAGLSPAGGSGSAAGDQGLPGGQPTIDEGAVARLAEATNEYAAHKAVFGQPPVKTALAKAGSSILFRLPDGSVPEAFFKPGPNGYGAMQALFRAAGVENALPIITDYAAASLKKAAMGPNGTIDPVRYQAWVTKYGDALRALPTDVRARFAGAADAAKAAGAKAADVAAANKVAAKSAEQAITAASAARAAALKTYQTGALGRVMGLTNAADVTRTIGQIVGSRTAVGEMGVLAKAAKAAGPDAVNGLRQAVADHIADRFVGNTEVGTSGVNQIKADAFQTFVRTNRAALRTVFSEPEVRSMEAVAKDIARSKLSETAVKLPGGSNTAQDTFAVKSANKLTGAGTRSFLSLLAGAAAEGGTHNTIAMLGTTLGAYALQALRERGLTRVDQIVSQAMLNPDLAAALMKTAPKVMHPKAGIGVMRALRRGAISGAAAANAGATP
jgi:hypothetical protein